MTLCALIGGSGIDQLTELTIHETKVINTPYGSPSDKIAIGELYGQSYLFLPRHGASHKIPPHTINYRANIWALKSLGVTHIIAFAAVGGITNDMTTGEIVIPDQLIDYTWGREHSYYDINAEDVQHIEFGSPYCTELRSNLISAANLVGQSVLTKSTYGVTQGPRLETAAEIDRMENDGANIVGMTGMPEAALAKELGIKYACIAIVVNPAAGRSKEPISMERILEELKLGSRRAISILKGLDADRL